MTEQQSASTVSYRLARRTDLPRMVRIWSEEKSEGGASEQRMTAYFDGEHHPQYALRPRVMYVAEEGDTLIGYVAGHLSRHFGCEGELQWIYVMTNRRRCGIASELVRRLGAWFTEQQAFRVCVNVDPENNVARRFYARMGAVPLNRHWLVWNRIDALHPGGKPTNTAVGLK